MAKVKSVDSCLLHFPVDYVYRTLMDIASYPKWWPKEITFDLERLNPGVTGTTVNVQNGILKWKSKIAGFKANKLLAIDYTGGAWIGKTFWRFEEADGSTKLSLEIDLDINRFWLKALSKVMNFQRIHSKQIHKVFYNLEKYLASNAHTYIHEIRISHLDHLVLTVSDIEKSCLFYQGTLGMEIITFGSGRRALKFGSQKINLHEAGKEYEPKADKPVPGSADLCFISHTGIERVIAELKSKGIEIIYGPAEKEGAEGKMNSVYIRDPDKNLIEISNYVK